MRIDGFDQQTAKRVLEATRATEAHPLGRALYRDNSAIGVSSAPTVVFKITLTTPTNGLYRCRWCDSEILNTGDPAITFTLQGEDGWAFGLNGGVLQLDTFYFGQFRGIKPDDGRAVFITGTASLVVVKCTSSTPTIVGGRYIFPGDIQTFRHSNLTFSNSKVCWIHDVNNVQTLTVNNLFLGFIAANYTDGKPIVLINSAAGGAAALIVKNLHSNTTYQPVTQIDYNSTPSAYNASQGDYVFSHANGILNERLNGGTESFQVVRGCASGALLFYTLNFSNGLYKNKTQS